MRLWARLLGTGLLGTGLLGTGLLGTGLLGLAVLLSASPAMADGWSTPDIFPNSQKKTQESDLSKTFKQIDAGTKKFIRGTIDVITLKPLWDNGKSQRQPVDPWMRHTRKKTEKKSFWDSWFAPKKEPKQAVTVGEWIGMDRPQ